MKSMQTWFDEYAVSHQNEKNIFIHFVCVPAIYFSVVGLLMCIPSGMIASIIPGHLPIIENWAFVVLILISIFYLRLSLKVAFQVILFTLACMVLAFYLGQIVSLWMACVTIFVVAWIGQFYGHKIEGMKPSFLKDIQYLMIGPAWVIHKMFGGGKK